MFPLPIRQLQTPRRHAVLEGFFSAFECSNIVSAAMKVPEVQATVSTERLTDDKARKSRLRWLYWSAETDWLFQRIGQAVTLLNERIYGFDLIGMQEAQYTEYAAPGSHYSWHQDFGEGNMSNRKLSLTIQLSEPSEYEGGELEIFELHQAIPKTLGTIVSFPAWEFHRVTPVTKGVRRSIVVWTQGTPFR